MGVVPELALALRIVALNLDAWLVADFAGGEGGGAEVVASAEDEDGCSDEGEGAFCAEEVLWGKACGEA